MAAREAAVTVFITLGSNIEPAANLPRALRRLEELLAVEAQSRFYESEPHGAPGTPRFWNAAVRARTTLAPAELKRELRRIESAFGRVRTADANAPRPIDLDIAFYGEESLDGAGIRVPDPEIVERAYLALPLAEVGPEVVHPASGETLASAARRLARGTGAPRVVAADAAGGRP